MSKCDTGELLLAKANAYVDTFVRLAIEMIWRGRKDITQMQLGWVEKQNQMQKGSTYRYYSGDVHVEHDGISVIVAFHISLYPQHHTLPTNIFGWAPQGYLACIIRSLPALKDAPIVFDEFAAAGQLQGVGCPSLPIMAVPKDRTTAQENLNRTRRELGLPLEP